ncbi:MAG TPA: alpha/beta fold hydrolase [Holophaga sp.]|nr:alpha/beta fold hydrolase [Holophaga sp.]
MLRSVFLPLLLAAPIVSAAPSSAPATSSAPVASSASTATAFNERTLVFQGQGGLALKGSLLAAGGSVQHHPFFAVFVAGSGAVDRDWSNPTYKDPGTGVLIQSHAGRDLARWLSAQGLGSLRFDKRFVGSRDAKLDVSLEAQLGDVKAAIATARVQPEAKGKRILLVGHDEGALLALLAAPEADAAMLIGMPPQSMAKSIRAMLEAQLPSNIASRNLAYLDQVFDAIRQQQPTPTAGAEVHEAMAAMGKALMAPETLSFVRSLLDIDPWALIARLGVPAALVWGDRDIQSLRPDRFPSSFHGLVLDIPQANHLLKREERPRSTLKASAAVRNYSDETPLADLSPLAEWLKRLAE